MADDRFAFLDGIWQRGEANYLIEDNMRLRFAISAAIINFAEIAHKRILDIGCGSTYVPCYLSLFERYHGIDVAPFVIAKNGEHFKDKNNVSFSVDNLEDFQEYDNYNIILCLGWAFFSHHASSGEAARPDNRLREVFVSKVSPHQHKLIILEVRNGEDYKVGVEDLEWLKEALLRKNFYVICDIILNIKPERNYSKRRLIALGGS